MSILDAGLGGAGTGGVLTLLYVLKTYFPRVPNGAYKGDSPRSIQALIQEQRDKQIMDSLARMDKCREDDHKEMMEVLGEMRDFLRDILNNGRRG